MQRFELGIRRLIGQEIRFGGKTVNFPLVKTRVLIPDIIKHKKINKESSFSNFFVIFLQGVDPILGYRMMPLSSHFF